MAAKFDELMSRWRVVDDLNSVSGYLRWDQKTYMPAGGAESRARLIATVNRLSHEHRIAPRLGELLDELSDHEQELEYNSDEAGTIRVARRDYRRWAKVPPDLFEEISRHTADTYQVWTRAREENDFAAVEPYLEKTLGLSQKYAECLAPYEHIADPLVSQYEPDMTVATVRKVFEKLRPKLVALLRSIESAPQVDASLIHQSFPVEIQRDLVDEVASHIGFDFEHGRLDQTVHPFTSFGSPTDVRITTRYREDDLKDALFGTIHEAGHGMYEQRIDPKFAGTPLSHGASFAVHESQSRMWENIVGRSRAFCRWILPRLHERFPKQFENASADDLYSAVNRVEGSLTRVDADEVTYNLHVMIRFDLEMQMLEGQLAVRDLPEAWNHRYESDLGIRPPDDTQGVLQDVHWYFWIIGGGFHGYTLGNILCGQLYDAAITANPGIPAGLEQGKFELLHDWLLENVYRHGRKFTLDELCEIATGRPLDAQPYVSYLETKFGELYGLPAAEGAG